MKARKDFHQRMWMKVFPAKGDFKGKIRNFNRRNKNGPTADAYAEESS